MTPGHAFGSTRQVTTGILVALGLGAALAGAMSPLRSHMSVAATALVLVVPVVFASAIGGLAPGLVATVTGFLVYDFLFIPPYYTFSVGRPQNWAVLVVYVVVMVVVSQAMNHLRTSRTEARRRMSEIRRLFDLSELLVRDSQVSRLFDAVVTSVLDAFGVQGAALLVPVEGRLASVASAGQPFSSGELTELSTGGNVPVSLETGTVPHTGVRAVALTGSSGSVGLLALRGRPTTRRDSALLHAFANYLALAIERAQSQEQALRAELLDEVERLRRSLLGRVSHELRTPLATIKVLTSTLRDPAARMSPAETAELAALADEQADRLDRLVANLLDMTRIQAGTLEVRKHPMAVGDLVDHALSVLGSSVDSRRVVWAGPDDLPLAEVDPSLVCQVLANLIDNAIKFSPEEAPVMVSATERLDGWLAVEVLDSGPGVPNEERDNIFALVDRGQSGQRGGLGLAVARSFVEVHGGQIWVEPAGAETSHSVIAGHGNPPAAGRPSAGARFVFTLPTATGT